jgi:DNA-binding transcriptional ArsR family regulator
MDAETLTALAEPNRLRIVEYLRSGPRSVSEIAGHLHIRQPQASKHLQVLSQAGLVAAQAVAQRRIYQLQATPFRQMESWLSSFRRLWEGRLDALELHLSEMEAQPKRRSAKRPNTKDQRS